MKKRIYVHKAKIRRREPDPISVKTYKGVIPCEEVEIMGPCTMVYNAKKPIDSGAHVWIETTALVRADGVEVR